MKRYFTKSTFKTALSCPVKLYYAARPELYNNLSDTDEFLAALAEGGFQVGELAKLYCHVDADLKHITDHAKALAETADLLKHETVTIAEAAFCYGNYFIRADIIEKRGNDIHLIEVKAKSHDPNEPKESFMASRPKGAVRTGYLEYIYDVAFQKYVLTHALPNFHVHASLMMANKSVKADVDHLNQLFQLQKQPNGQTTVVVDPNAMNIINASSQPVLEAFDVDAICDSVIRGETKEQEKVMGMKFVPFVEAMCEAWMNKSKPCTKLGTKCFKCEFRKGDSALRDGHEECWCELADFTDDDFKRPQVEELWGMWADRSKMISEGKYFLSDITEDDLKLRSDKPAEGLDHCQRKWLQIALATRKPELLENFQSDILTDNNTYMDIDGLRQRFKDFTPPLHMIDFETSAVALPYHMGMRPYEQIAFQFSHHIIDIQQDGSYTIRHAGQWLNNNVSDFPNFDFVRALREQLCHDNGTIFRYANHENTILKAIKVQLENSDEADKKELIDFIDSITDDAPRSMVDLLEIVKSYYYNYAEMHGSNSIKKVLPAVLNSSGFLQHKYSQAIYGSEILSLNIDAASPIAWIKYIDGTTRVENPYHLLPSVAAYLGKTDEEIWQMEENSLDDEDDSMAVANGGAALTAYSKLLFCDGQMDAALRTALLRYCELDTMAMVFIWEYFHHAI